MEGGNESGRHHFGVRHSTLRVFVMAHGFQQFGPESRHDGTLVVHGGLLSELWVS